MSGNVLLRWMHISDLNLQGGGPFSNDVALSRLVKNISSGPLSKTPLDFIFCTGDVAFSGKAEEYSVARKFFHRLSEAARVPLERIFTVPGNHDVEWERLHRSFRLDIPNEKSSRRFFESEEDLAIALRPLHNYVEHENHVFGRSWSSKSPFVIARCELRGITVALLGLNTTWLARHDGSRGELVVGYSLLKRALDEIKRDDPDFVVALMHHPVDSLAQFEHDRVHRLLSRDADFVLHGHIHDSDVYEISPMPDGAAFLGAGAGSHRPTDRRSFLIVEVTDREVQVQPHFYSELAAGQWQPTSKSAIRLDPARLRRHPDRSSDISVSGSRVDLERYAQTLQRFATIGGGILSTHAPATSINDMYVPRHLQLQEVTRLDPERTDAGDTVDVDLLQHRNGRVLILAEPGGGKTTLLKKLLLEWAQNLLMMTSPDPAMDGREVPVYLPLRQITDLVNARSRGSQSVLQQLLLQELEPYGGSKVWLQSLLETGRLFLLLDGVDEISSRAAQRKFLRVVGDFSERWPKIRIVVTSRPVGYHSMSLAGSTDLRGFVVCYLRPFSEEQIKTFIVRALSTIVRDNERSQQLTDNLLEAIRENRSLSALANSPLMLWVIVLTYLNVGRLPERRGELYQRVIDTYIGRWDEARGLSRASPFGDTPIRLRVEVLQRLALIAHQRGAGHFTFTASNFSDVLESVVPAISKSDVNQEFFIRELAERTGRVVPASVRDPLTLG